MVLLIYPPLVKPSEPPPGLALLAGSLKAHAIPHTVIDANIEGILSLLSRDTDGRDTWTQRAVKNRGRHMAAIHDLTTYASIDRYSRSVRDINRLLSKSPGNDSYRLSLSNMESSHYSPLRSTDLLRAASRPGENPFFPYFSRRLTEAVDETSPSFVGFSLNFLSQAVTAFAMMGFLRNRFPRLPIVCGGGLVTSWMRSTCWSDPFRGLIDHLVDGPGEETIVTLGGGTYDPTCTAGPDFGSFPLDSYFSPGRVLPYSASRGCWWNRCSFCPEQAEGNPFVPLPAHRILDDLQALTTIHNPALFHIVDNALSPATLNTLASFPPHQPWYGFARFTNHLADRDFCIALRQSGCVMLKLGLESGDQAILDGLRKGNDLIMVSQILTNLKDAGIGTYIYLLFGTPHESLDEARSTLDFIVRHHRCIDFLNLAIFNLPRNSPDSSRLVTNQFYDGDLSLYADFVHPRGWGRRQVRAFLAKEFTRHRAVQPIIRRDPPFFTSNHAPFFTMAAIR